MEQNTNQINQPVTQNIPVQAPPPTTPLPQPMEVKPKKNSAGVVLLIIFALVLLGVVGFLAYQNYQLKSQVEKLSTNIQISPSPVPQDISPLVPTDTQSSPTPSSWKNYTNTLYGYSIEFPSNWRTQAQAAGSGDQEALPISQAVDIFDTKMAAVPYPSGVITIQGYGATPSYNSTWTKTESSINGYAVTKYQVTNGPDNGLTAVVYLFKTPQGKYVEVLFRYGEKDLSINTFNEIIKTIKFTN